MKILFCNFEYPPLGGGGGVINAHLARELAKKHDVTVLTSKRRELPADTLEKGVRVIRVPVLMRRKNSIASLTSMATFLATGSKKGLELLKKESFDVINTHFVLPTGPVGVLLSRQAGIPNVLSLHGGDLYDPTKFLSPHRHAFLRWMVRGLLRRADLVVGQSNNTLANMRKFYTPEIDGVRIPLAINRPEPVSGGREMYGFADDEKILITIGRLVARKGVDQLIRMMRQFAGEKVRLLILGSGPQSQELKNLVVRHHLEQQVMFMGFVSDEEKFRLLNLSDVYVSTSQHEGFGIVYLEGMAFGLPIIAYDEGGQTDFLEDGRTGFLVSLNQLDRFTARTREMIQDDDLRQKIGQTNRQLVEEFFIDRCASRYEEFFCQAIDAHIAGRQHISLGQRTG